MPHDHRCKIMSSEKPIFISIIIPSFNTEKQYIQRALDSVMAQTIHDYEIIVVDDGSNAEYLSVLEELCDEREKILLIRAKHGGVSTARNTGVLHAAGEYIAFLDADDLLAPDFLERSLRVQRETSADVVIGGTIFTADLTGYQFPERSFFPAYQLYSEEEIRQLRQHSVGPAGLIRFPGGYINRGPVARLVRRSLAQEIPFDTDLKNGEDILWNLRIFNLCHKVCIVPEVWYGYWINTGSTTHRYNPAFIDECMPHLERLPSLLDLSNEAEYAAYLDRIHEELRSAWTNELSTARTLDRNAYRTAVRKIYSEWPWSEIGSNRGFQAANIKQKAISLLYRLQIYFFVKEMKERFSK